jgi:hypothetical protein
MMDFAEAKHMMRYLWIFGDKKKDKAKIATF